MHPLDKAGNESILLAGRKVFNSVDPTLLCFDVQMVDNLEVFDGGADFSDLNAIKGVLNVCSDVRGC